MLRGYKTEMVISQIGQWSLEVLGVDIRDTVCHSNDQSNEEVKCSTVRTSFCVQFLPMRDSTLIKFWGLTQCGMIAVGIDFRVHFFIAYWLK